MQEELLNYNEIIAYFTEETITERFKYLYDKMQEYINERNQQDCLMINEDILHQVLMDYFTDIYVKFDRDYQLYSEEYDTFVQEKEVSWESAAEGRRPT